MFTSQLACQGACKQIEIVEAFGVTAKSVKRNVKKFCEEGIESFYRLRKPRGATVITDDVIAAAQDLLNRGQSRRQITEMLDIKYDTLRKGINQGRLRELSQPPSQPHVAQPAAHSTTPQSQPTPSLPLPTDKSQRGVADVAAEMGVACTRAGERVLAAFGMLQGASTRFEECRDVSFHKFPKENWAVEEFQETLVTLSCGEVGGASGAIEVRAAVPQSQTLDGYSEDDCIPGRDVDDADCARIISERS